MLLLICFIIHIIANNIINRDYLPAYLNSLDYKKSHILTLWHRVCFNIIVKTFESFYYSLYNALVKFSMMYIHQKEEALRFTGDFHFKKKSPVFYIFK